MYIDLHLDIDAGVDMDIDKEDGWCIFGKGFKKVVLRLSVQTAARAAFHGIPDPASLATA